MKCPGFCPLKMSVEQWWNNTDRGKLKYCVPVLGFGTKFEAILHTYFAHRAKTENPGDETHFTVEA
jgi:hypothetical protein